MVAKGSRRAASTFERKAWLLAQAMAAGVNGFDSKAAAGMVEFAADMVAAPRAVIGWVDGLASQSDLEETPPRRKGGRSCSLAE